jgi:hypothetical protein
MTIGGGQAAYQLVGSGGQGAQIGWLWYVDPSGPIKPVDLTSGGKFDAFQIEVLEMSGPIVVQIDPSGSGRSGRSRGWPPQLPRSPDAAREQRSRADGTR